MNCCANTEKSVKKVTEVKKKRTKNISKRFTYIVHIVKIKVCKKKTVDYVIITKRELLKNQ